MTSIVDDKDRVRRAKAFERRKKAAVDGVHLPSLIELFRLMPYYGNSLRSDIQAFAERLLPRINGESEAARSALQYLSEMTVSADMEACFNASTALCTLRTENPRRREMWVEASRRCLFYAACLGHATAMGKVAGMLGQLAESPSLPSEVVHDLAVSSIGWMLMASDFSPIWTHSRKDTRESAFERGSGLYDLIQREVDQMISTKTTSSTDQPATVSNTGEVQGSNENSAPGTVVVLQRLGNTDIGEGKKIEKEFREIAGKPLTLIPLPDLGLIERTLDAEFPHAAAVTHTFLSGLSGKQHVAMRPTVLFGSPGCGKTTYVERLLDVLGVPNESYSCGGVSDSAMVGTSRRWHTGEPSVPVAMIRRYAAASPGIILDELEKASLSRHNGSLYDVLLAWFESQSARKWVDPYIQAPVDLSHVIWIGTSNSLKGIPSVLLDRCRAIRFPEPRIEDLPAIAHQMLKRLVEKRDLKPGWAIPFSTAELDAMSRLWSDRSLRTLGRLVEAVFVARERGMSQQ